MQFGDEILGSRTSEAEPAVRVTLGSPKPVCVGLLCGVGAVVGVPVPRRDSGFSMHVTRHVVALAFVVTLLGLTVGCGKQQASQARTAPETSTQSTETVTKTPEATGTVHPTP
jgi:hypothetical protein